MLQVFSESLHYVGNHDNSYEIMFPRYGRTKSINWKLNEIQI